mgnify:CR=1 FL=1
MPNLNLEAKNETQKIIKDYLEKNVSDMLADKINNGVRIQKDGKTLISKKTLAGCMDFALKEAQKLTEKSARAACIQDSVVFGWAIHFFEEDSIEGTLYNEDGTEYKPPKPVTPPKPATTYTPPKPQPKPQMSLFELMENNATEEKPSENTQYVLQKTEQSDNPERDDEELCEDTETEEEPTKEELREAAETERDLPLPAMPEKAKAVQMQGSPFYQRYMRIQDKYPHCIVLFSRGDFYEALGKGAQLLAENLGLTLTGRDCGFLERVPMVGIPCHAIDVYIGKAIEKGLKLAIADTLEDVKEYPGQAAPQAITTEMEQANQETEAELPIQDDSAAEDGKHWLDDNIYIDDDGLVHDAAEEAGKDDEPAFDMSAYDAEALAKLDEIFGNLLELR